MSRFTLCLLLVAIVICGSAYGEDLKPPGPPGSAEASMRTLNEIEPATPIESLPYSITNSGAYIMVDDLRGKSGFDGIEILVGNVTLDLNGLTLRGVAGSQNAIDIASDLSSVTVRNGVIREWGYYGIYTYNTRNCIFEDLTVVTNGWGANCSGIYVGKYTHIRNCIVTDNKASGIYAMEGSTIEKCKVSDNGMRGIDVQGGSSVIDCSAAYNGTQGIAAYYGCTITRCTAYMNQGDGIYAAKGSTVDGCTAYENQGAGIDAGAGVTVRGCSAAENILQGINAGGGSTVQGCTAYRNEGDGIRCSYNTYILNNSCSAAGYQGDGAGIHATAYGNRIDGNHVTSSDRGVQVAGTYNIIVRNTARGNSDEYDINPTNDIGTIRTSMSSAGPWDNFDL